MRCHTHALDQEKSDFFIEFGYTRRVSRHAACLDFFANLICLLFSIFTNDVDKVILLLIISFDL
jgi:hypothetical protein